MHQPAPVDGGRSRKSALSTTPSTAGRSCAARDAAGADTVSIACRRWLVLGPQYRAVNAITASDRPASSRFFQVEPSFPGFAPVCHAFPLSPAKTV